jgi:hypothetical protein
MQVRDYADLFFKKKDAGYEKRLMPPFDKIPDTYSCSGFPGFGLRDDGALAGIL